MLIHHSGHHHHDVLFTVLFAIIGMSLGISFASNNVLMGNDANWIGSSALLSITA